MKMSAMCFSLMQFPRCRLHSLAQSWLQNFYNSGSSSYRILCSTSHDPEGWPNGKWSRRTIITKAEGYNEGLIDKGCDIDGYKLVETKVPSRRKKAVGDNVISRRTKANLNKCEAESTEIESDQDYEEIAKLATIICFDIETTGYNSAQHRIVEIAFQDLRGGQNSTFQTLVNPERDVPKRAEAIHGISSQMVRSRDVPRMKNLIPIMLEYIKSRQQPGGIVILVAHNARKFDVPFLKREFERCNYEFPKDWEFGDTLDLARALKDKGLKVPSKLNLQYLREHYGIPLMGKEHRALSDVHTLAYVFQRLTMELKLTKSDLIPMFRKRFKG
ncbi:exonuclease DPD1, chloroplastic/mitochondrial [Andrographis paniculata]|uniref:exonuclease DPD1, chloroplastic/mitochondrial n=1 Tax=Andrographis paniculata TaxID=175694 RepID=UPI0021E6DAAF|nr:exonuclease DPD1, chloroplastic/mitochondrial [Andrographis paniculata]